MKKIGLRRITSLVGLLALLVGASLAAEATSSEAAKSESTSAESTPSEPTRAQRLAKLTEVLEEQRQDLHIPGMAMAVIQGDELIYSRGFGSADLEQGTPVTPETVFAVGSTTKAFTGALIGMLVDEGKMSWDDPVTKFLPDFELNIDSDDPAATVTLRDLLAHRTGFTRMGLLWAGGKVSRDEVLKTATRAEPWSPFREKFYYNNVTFSAAGMASGVAAGTSWDDLLAKRLLKPLAMKRATTSVRQAKRDDRLSLGYRWQEEAQSHERVPMRSLDSVAPAGAINANVLDMAQWLRFQLGRGTYEGRVLLSEAQHRETWRPQIQAGPGVGYGFGWMLREVDGRRVVEHGGNIDGFAAQVTLFPDEDLGFVLLTNVTVTSLQGFSSGLVADALLADWAEEGDTTSASDALDVYTGKYVANFGAFKNMTFTVSARDDRLAVDVPGQTNYQLEPPDGEGKWYFSLTREVAVSFVREDDGPVVALKMHQGGMTFELPKDGVEQPVEIDLATLQPFLGTYRSEARNLDFEVKVANQRLAVDVPGETVYDLHPPDEEGRWVFRAISLVAVGFTTSEDGRVTALKLYRGGSEQLELARVDGSEPAADGAKIAALPTVEDILALRTQAGDAAAYRLTGRLRFVHSGVEGRMSHLADGAGRYRSDTDLGRFGWIHQAIGKDRGWTNSNIQPFQELEGKFFDQAIASQALAIPENWLQTFDSIKVSGTEMVGDRRAHAVQLRLAELPAITALVDATTGDLLRFEMTIFDPNLGIAIATETRLEDYRDLDGVRVAHRIVSRNELAGESVFEIESFEPGVTVDPVVFAPPSGE